MRESPCSCTTAREALAAAESFWRMAKSSSSTFLMKALASAALEPFASTRLLTS